MPKISKNSVEAQDHGPVEEWGGELDGYTANIVVFRQDMDQSPHWGYVLKGRLTFRVGDHEEVFEPGDAFYLPPGHVGVANEPGSEFVQFSPSEELKATEAVIMKNMQEMQGA